MPVQEGYTPLYTAAARGYNDVVKLLLAANADPNCINIVSFILLWLSNNQLAINCLYYIHVCLQDQYTPLYIASAKGFNKIVKSLIAANADVNFLSEVSC